jgi:AcrR family transcriptional regulator
MIEVGSLHGYAATSVGHVLDSAGVSRSTYYEHFRDKDDCFLASLRLLSDRALARFEAEPVCESSAAGAAARSILGFMSEEASGGRLLFVESLAAGSRALDIRRSTIERLVATARSRQNARADPAELSEPLVAGICRLLAIRLRGGSAELSDGEIVDLLRWLDSYDLSWSAHAALNGSRPAGPPRAESLPPLEPLTVLTDAARGAVSLSRNARHRRLRVMAAVATCAHERSYSETTVAEITAAAGISRKAFYELFPDKAAAATEANQRYFQAAMTATAGEFFAVPRWPDRIWGAGAALLQFLALHPVESYLAFVETHAIGDGAVRLTYDRLAAFTLFLEEGYGFRPEAQKLPRIWSEALMATMFELAFRELHARRSAEKLLSILPRLTFIVLAPFMGAPAAADFLSG